MKYVELLQDIHTSHFTGKTLSLLCTYLEHAKRFHLLHKIDITCHYAPLLAVTMDLREVRRASTGYTDTHFAMQNIVITMHLPGVCKVFPLTT